MAKTVIIFVVLNGLLVAFAKPQYGPPSGPAGPAPPSAPAPPQPSYAGGTGGSVPPPPPAPPAPAPAPSSYGGPAAAPPAAPPAPAPSSYGGAGGAGGGARDASGGQITVQCKASPDGSGKVKYDCSGANKEAITLKTEHILWLESQQGATQNLDIEIPNYNIDEFIKAAFKALGPQEGNKINILLKKPDVTYNAQKDEPPKQESQPPAVSLNYQPVEKISVHYPSQKPYSNAGGSAGGAQAGPAAPAPAPAAGGAGNYGGQQPAPAPSGGAGNYGGQQPAPAAPAPSGGAYSRPYRHSQYYFRRQ